MTTRLDTAFDFDALLTGEELDWARKAREFATEPHPAGDRAGLRRQALSPGVRRRARRSSAFSACTSATRDARVPARSAMGSSVSNSRRRTADGAPSSPCRVRSRWARSPSSARRSRNTNGCRAMAARRADRVLRAHRADRWQRPGGHAHHRAERDGADWVIDGKKRWIGLASIADVAVVWAKTEDGVRGFLVPTEHPGVHGDADRHQTLDARIDPVRHRPRRRAGARFRACCRAPAGCPGRSAASTTRGTGSSGERWARRAPASRRHSIARRSREVFGRPIGANQLIQAKLANMLVEYEKGVLLALHLGRLKERDALTPTQISVGKLNSVREAIAIASEARAILGGDGITERVSGDAPPGQPRVCAHLRGHG